MSEYLASLVARTRPSPGAVRPKTPGLFEAGIPAAPESTYERDEAVYPGPEDPRPRFDGAHEGRSGGPTSYGGQDPGTGRLTAFEDPTPPRAAMEQPTRPEARMTIPDEPATADVRSAVTHPARGAPADDPPAPVFERVELHRDERADTAFGRPPPQLPASTADARQPTRASERPPDLLPPAIPRPVTPPVVAASTRLTSVPDESAGAPESETVRGAPDMIERPAPEVRAPRPSMSDALLIPTADRPVLTADTPSSFEGFQRPDARRSTIDMTPAPAPVVHVTIGRVEVRAPLSSSQPKIPVRSTPDATTLDAYLRARAKGDRR